MDFLLWLESTSVAEAVRTSTWVYPWVNSFHSVGMGFLVGVSLMIILRVLGFGRFSIAPLHRYVLIVQIGIAVNVITGFMLFSADAQRFFLSPTFRVKALLIVLGGIATWVLVRRIFRAGADLSASGEAAQMTKVIAGACLVFWVGAIFAGRMTAYLP